MNGSRFCLAVKPCMVVALWLFGCANPLYADTTAELFAAINARLSYMQDVATYKALHELPVEDLPREAVVLQESKLAAAAAGLQADSVEAFFLAQINIAKIIQYRHRAALLAGLEIQETPDLELVIRPALDALGVAITQLLAQRIAEAGQLTEENWDQFNDTVTAAYLETADKRRLFQSLLSVTAQ